MRTAALTEMIRVRTRRMALERNMMYVEIKLLAIGVVLIDGIKPMLESAVDVISLAMKLSLYRANSGTGKCKFLSHSILIPDSMRW